MRLVVLVVLAAGCSSGRSDTGPSDADVASCTLEGATCEARAGAMCTALWGWPVRATCLDRATPRYFACGEGTISGTGEINCYDVAADPDTNRILAPTNWFDDSAAFTPCSDADRTAALGLPDC